MQALVAGGAGYVGSIASQELIRAGHNVVVFDSLDKGHAAAAGCWLLALSDIS